VFGVFFDGGEGRDAQGDNSDFDESKIKPWGTEPGRGWFLWLTTVSHRNHPLWFAFGLN